MLFVMDRDAADGAKMRIAKRPGRDHLYVATAISLRKITAACRSHFPAVCATQRPPLKLPANETDNLDNPSSHARR
ncbi:hypothetical protein CBM2599_A120518 [Cupriavidus taiwanensis]|nr:hypothetical protein CBM2599_A120518 [Cupriavidus taiwanensis]